MFFGSLVTGLRDAFLGERHRWPLWLPVFFGAGIASYFYLPEEPARGVGAFATGGALLLLFVMRNKGVLAYVAIVLTLFACGFLAAQARTWIVAAPTIERSTSAVLVEGVLLALEPKGGAKRLLLHDLHIEGVSSSQTPERVRVRVAGALDPGIVPGLRIRVRAVLRPPPEPVAPGAFDFARHAYFLRLGGVGYAVSSVEPLPGGGDTRQAWKGRWRVFWETLRLHVADRIGKVLHGDRGAVAIALTTGLRGELSEQSQALMRDAGLAHLLAISGLHMGLVAGWIFTALRFVLAAIPTIALVYPIKKWAAAAAIVVAFAYLFMAGATIPTQRAFLMVGVVLLAVLIDRRALTLRLVAWAAVVVLTIAPESILSASFQLSFAAVVALVATYEVITQRWERSPKARTYGLRFLYYLSGIALTSLVASAATAPFVAYNFNRVALYGLISNMVAVPLTALWIMPWAIIAMLLMPFGLEAVALQAMGKGIDAVLEVAAFVVDLPAAVMSVASMPVGSLIAYALGGLWLCLWQRPWRFLGVAGFAIGAGLPLLHQPPDIFISGDARNAAIRLENTTLSVMERRIGRFDREQWSRISGATAVSFWPVDGAAPGGQLRCDALGCIYSKENHLVAFVKDGRALVEDCHSATLLISREPLRGLDCPHPTVVIDRFDLWREGAHSVRLKPDGPFVESVRAVRGRRPWVAWR